MTKKSLVFLAALFVTGFLGLVIQAHTQLSAYAANDAPKAVPILNNSFEEGTFGEKWYVSPGMDQAGTFVVDSGSASGSSDGRYYAKLSRGTGDAHVASDWAETDGNVSNKSFRLTFDIKSHTPSASISGILIQRYPKNGTDWSQVGTALPLITATNSWQTKTHIVSLPTPANGNTSSKVRVVLRANNEAYAQPIYYDNIRLEEMPAGTPTPSLVPTSTASASLVCGDSCTANTQCADGLSCYQPMKFAGDHWSETTGNLADIGSGEVTGWDTFFMPDGTRVQNFIKGGILYSRYGSSAPTNPWRIIDFACGSEDTTETCCMKSGACGESLTENPNDKLYGINLYQVNDTDVSIHITRQESGIYAKTLKLTELDDEYLPFLRRSDGWSLQTQAAKFNELDGEFYLSFNQGKDLYGNRVQHVVKFDGGDPFTTYVYRRYGWLNRGYSKWTEVVNSTNQTKNIDFEFGNKSTEGVVASVDPLYANNTHYNHIIRGTIQLENAIYSLTHTKLYQYDAAQVDYTGGVCRNVYSPTNACDSDLRPASSLEVTFRCSDGVASLSWNKNASTGAVPNYYEIAICRTGECTTNAQWEENIVHKIGFNASGDGNFAASYPGGYIKGQAYDFTLRPALYENETRIKTGAWVDVVTKTMAGPTGDMDADCDVDITDYTTYLDSVRNPYAPESLFVRMIYFFNALIANLGTRN